VMENYTQLIQGMYGNSIGFTFEQFKEEIDNGRPVILQLAGHSMLGFGYDAGNLVYLHDTWDHSVHSMTWGGSYAGMAQWGVTVVRLASDNPPPLADFSSNAVSLYTGQYVQFSDLSSYTPSAWEWTFEGGSPGNSTQQNPLVTYMNPGIYPVKLKASNPYGYDTEVKPAWINVMQPSCVKILEINLLLEGLYNPTLGEMNKALHDQGAVFPGTIADVITVCLSLPGEITNPVYCLENMPLHQNGLCTVYLPDSLSGSFYIKITHRNSLETWSSHPVNICSDSTSYDFTDHAGKAFGNNLKGVGNVFCLYSGDINQDGIIDSGDLIALDNAIQSFASGYLPEDINGDGMPDLEDLMIIEENAGFFVVKKVPE